MARNDKLLHDVHRSLETNRLIFDRIALCKQLLIIIILGKDSVSFVLSEPNKLKVLLNYVDDV